MPTPADIDHQKHMRKIYKTFERLKKNPQGILDYYPPFLNTIYVDSDDEDVQDDNDVEDILDLLFLHSIFRQASNAERDLMFFHSLVPFLHKKWPLKLIILCAFRW